MPKCIGFKKTGETWTRKDSTLKFFPKEIYVYLDDEGKYYNDPELKIPVSKRLKCLYKYNWTVFGREYADS